MKLIVPAAALMLAAAPVFAQTSGVSHPDAAAITADDNQPPAVQAAPVPVAKPSAAIPAQPAPTATVYGPYVPYSPAAADSVAAIPVSAPADDPDAMIVTGPPDVEGQISEGTLLHTRMMDTISTRTTARGTVFTAELMEPIEKDGRVILPIGSVLSGQVTEVHGGRRIAGSSAVHLETRDITLPDGTHYVVHAQLIDTNRTDFKVTNEGTLKQRENVKEDAAILGGVTGAGAVSGAVFGGGVGALVGAGIGAGVSTVVWLRQDREATLPKDVRLTFSLTTPMVLTPLSNPAAPGLHTHDGGGLGAAQ